jgi:NAD(P)-dependent dehydrogenase (short-subunit alcohol dehydrogenase family)
MSKRRVLITGGTSGIGREVASQIARQGAALVLAARDAARGAAVAAEIAEETGGPAPQVVECDTSSQRSIRACAKKVRSTVDRLDVLINNAGIRRLERRITPEKIEEVFATNMLGYHLLTHELLDLLKSSAPARIVNVASTYAGELDFDDLEFSRRPWDSVQSYKQSKQANRLWTWALARRLEGTRVTANAMSPGLVFTGLYRDMGGAGKAFMSVLARLFGRSVAVGADTVTWLAMSPDVDGVSGKFWELRRQKACEFRGQENEERMWKVCESFVERSAQPREAVPLQAE